MITTTLGDMDESLLMKKTGGLDNDNETTTWVEYCRRGCRGSAHITDIPDSESHFCSQHVHRSVDMFLKKGILGHGAVASLGG